MSKTIEELYTEYNIMPTLRLHMYRVTAVASILCDHFSGAIDRKSVVQACLLHDMGNIIKFDLDLFPDLLAPEGKEYWQKIKDEFIKKYETDDEHATTLKIAEEVNANLRTLELLNSCGFNNAPEILLSKELEKKICLYADMRVGPHAIVSLDERFADLTKRYENNPGYLNKDSMESIRKIEKEIFKVVAVAPSFITESSVANIVPYLRTIHIHS